MEKLDDMGIRDYYKNLPFGSKDEFIRKAAEGICRSSSTIYQKIRKGNWTRLELQVINGIIDEM